MAHEAAPMFYDLPDAAVAIRSHHDSKGKPVGGGHSPPVERRVRVSS
jgi:hypothetical protein